MQDQLLTVIYQGDSYDEAIQQELKRQGLEHGQVKLILAIPESLRPKENKQGQLFDG